MDIICEGCGDDIEITIRAIRDGDIVQSHGATGVSYWHTDCAREEGVV